ncbi:MAG: PIN domain-containing protein [Myxococcales bacterium]|nr:PIN domain-containing protein [Myxococcales bacterium]
MRAIDTNVLCRLLARDDEKQVLAAEAYVSEGAWVSHLVLLEAAWVLTSIYRTDARQLAGAIAMLLQHEHLALQDPDVIAAALAHFRKRPALGFSDCLIYETARKAGHLPLGTFDRDLAKLDGVDRIAGGER